VQVLFQFLVHQRFCLNWRLQVLNFERKRLFRLFEDSSFVRKFSLGFFVEVTDLNLRFLAFVHEAFLELLDAGDVFGDLFLVLFGLAHFLLL
jgi:hypothetical protein